MEVSVKDIGIANQDAGLSLENAEESLLFTEESDGKTAYRVIKRIADVVLSILGLILLSPVFLVTALVIKIEDGEPVIFHQKRSGLNGKPFLMYKFRSMKKDAELMHKDLLPYNEYDGAAFKMKNDPRVTKVGRFIRRTSIDELPQLVNVLKGEMSIVGPRPLPLYETAKCTAEQNRRLAVKPGLTCYWQCSGRSNIPFDEWMEMDQKYIEDAGVWTDVKIILKTFVAVFSGEGAL